MRKYPPDKENAGEIFVGARRLSLKEVTDTIRRHHKIVLLLPNSTNEARVRATIYYLLSKDGLSLEQIARAMSREVDVVRLGYRRIEAELLGNLKFQTDIKALIEELEIGVSLEFDSKEIVAEVCKKYNVSESAVLSESRKSTVTRVRHILCYVLYKQGRLSLPKIGEVLKRNHVTILNGYLRIKSDLSLDTNASLRADIQGFRQLFQRANVKSST